VPLYWSEQAQSCTSGDDGVHFTQQPPDRSNSTSATVSWSYVDGIGTTPSVTCAFDHATAADCTNVLSRTFTSLGDGGHEFEVRLSDQSQVLGQIQSAWIVNTFTPVTFVFRPSYFTTSSHPTFSYQSGDPEPIAFYDVRFRHATPTTGFSAWATPTGGAHRTSGSMSIGGVGQGEDVCVEARATDDLGNVGGWSTQQCTARMVDDHSSLLHHPSTSRYWSRGTGSGYYFATYTRTYRTGQVLTIAGRSVRRAAILVTTCPTCGSLLITFAGHKVAGFRLYSKTRRLSVLIGLPTFAVGTGLLALKTTGGRVTIDGVGLSAT